MTQPALKSKDGEKGEIVGLVKQLPSEIRNIIQSHYSRGLYIRRKMGAPKEMDMTVKDSLHLMLCHADRMWQHFCSLKDIYEEWLDAACDWEWRHQKGQLEEVYDSLFEEAMDVEEFTLSAMQDQISDLQENLNIVNGKLFRLKQGCRYHPIYRKKRPEWKEPEEFKNKRQKV